MIKGLPRQSMVEAEQRKTISKTQLLEYRCTLDAKTMKRVKRALRISERESQKYSHRKKSKPRQ
jgi:mRNA-degrading endonuclease toxin of MazEF toxin-antitoxin module